MLSMEEGRALLWLSFSLLIMFFRSILLPVNIHLSFDRNDNVETSIESYREAFDVVYLVSLQSDAIQHHLVQTTLHFNLPPIRTWSLYLYFPLCRMMHLCGELSILYLNYAHLTNKFGNLLDLPTAACLTSFQICTTGDLLTQDTRQKNICYHSKWLFWSLEEAFII